MYVAACRPAYDVPMRIAVLAVLVACGSPNAGPSPDAPSPDGARSDAPDAAVSAASFTDEVFVGYQGWFAAAGDGSPLGTWYHWGHGEPGPGNVTFELYPDVRGYPAADLFEAGFAHLGNGAPATLFGSWSDGVVAKHFEWLEANGLDGVALQRFVVALKDPLHFQIRTEIATKVRAAAEQHGRLFYLTYDISGADPMTWVADIETDYADVMEALTTSPAYAREHGKPVVCIWGFGFPDRPGEPGESLALVQWFQARGVYVIGGVPYWWRTGTEVKPGFDPVFAAVDLLQPWGVGSVRTDADVDSHFSDVVAGDVALTSSRGQAYQRVIFPGFAWSNWNGGTPNMIPRRAGALFWRQAYRAAQAHVSTMIAMFDEYDEGTAIAPAAEDASMIPTDQYFLTLDADGQHVSSDFYLRLAGAATRMLHGQDPVQPAIPVPLQ